MTFSETVNKRIAAVWDGSNFVEQDLVISGADGISVSEDSVKITISGNEAALQANIAALSGYVDTQDTATLSSANSYTDTEITSLSGYAEGAFVNITGDTMTGDLTLAGAPTSGSHAATKDYVDSQVAGAVIEVKDDDVQVVASVAGLDFGHALDVISEGGGTEARIDVDESEFTTVVFLSGDQNISGIKTFLDDVAIVGDLQVSGVITQLILRFFR